MKVPKMYQVLEEAKVIWEANSELVDFCHIEGSLISNNLAPTTTAGSSLVTKAEYRASKKTIPLIQAIKNHAHEANWLQTYSTSEVGKDFSNRHCYFELIGPKGHFYNEKIRAFICYWGAHLNYKWHSHEAEEMYYVLGGQATFRTVTVETVLKAGDTQFHKSWESHSMDTLEEPMLAFILWRGNGLNQLAKIDE